MKEISLLPTKQHRVEISDQAGFTLLEILVVMLIIAVLVGLGLSSFRNSQIKSKDAKRIADLDQVSKALESYHADKGYYPVSDEDSRIKIFYDMDENGTVESGEFMIMTWGSKFYDPAFETTIYMGNLPTDPSGQRRYYYRAYHRDCTGGSCSFDKHTSDDEPDDYKAEAYRLYAKLENDENMQAVGDISDTDCANPDAGGEAVPCNYVLQTSNLPITPTASP